MRRPSTPLLALLLALPVLLLTACGGDHDDHGHGHGHGHDDGHAHEEGHEHGEGPHGGQILDVANETAHLEVEMNHDTKAIVVHVLDTSNAPLLIKDAPAFAFGEGEARKTLTASPVEGKDGRASEWHFRDDAFGGEIEGGTFTLKLGTETHTVSWEHDCDHHEGHADKDGD